MIRKAMRWRGEIDADLIAHLVGNERPPAWSAVATVDPVRWAMEILGFGVDEIELLDDARGNGNGNGDRDLRPSRRDVQRRYRVALREAHPDHGGDRDDAAARIGDLAEARRILLG